MLPRVQVTIYPDDLQVDDLAGEAENLTLGTEQVNIEPQQQMVPLPFSRLAYDEPVIQPMGQSKLVIDWVPKLVVEKNKVTLQQQKFTRNKRARTDQPASAPGSLGHGPTDPAERLRQELLHAASAAAASAASSAGHPVVGGGFGGGGAAAAGGGSDTQYIDKENQAPFELSTADVARLGLHGFMT